jgi:hypothetical protein
MYHNLVCNFIKLHVQKLKLQDSKKSQEYSYIHELLFSIKTTYFEKGSVNGVQALLSLTKGTGV